MDKTLPIIDTVQVGGQRYDIGYSRNNYDDDEKALVHGAAQKAGSVRYLPKNIKRIDGVPTNVLEQGMIDSPGTVYVIRYDFDLNGGSVKLPPGCTIEFISGSIGNGTVAGDNSTITADDHSNIFRDVAITGTWHNARCSVCWFGAKTSKIDKAGGYDCLAGISKAMESSFRNIYFPVGNFYISDTIYVHTQKNVYLEGNVYGEQESNQCARIWATKDIDVFYVCYDGYEPDKNVQGRSFKLRGGKIYLYYASRYTKSAVHLSCNRNSKIWGVEIETSICGKASGQYAHDGNGILIDGDDHTPGNKGYVTDIRINSYIFGFAKGIHADHSNGGGWISSMNDYSTITWCKHAVVMENCINTNLRGVYQPMYAWGAKDNGQSLLIINANFVNVDATIWDIGQGKTTFTNQYAIELGDVEYITLSGLPTLFSLNKIKGFSTNKVTTTQYERLKGGKQFGYDDSYNCLQSGSPYFEADFKVDNATLEGFDNLFKDTGDATITVTDSTKDVVLRIEITPKFIPLYLIGIDLNCSKGGHFRTIELDTNIVQGNETKPYHDEIHPTSTHEWMERWYFSFEKLYVSDKVTLTFRDIYPNSREIKLGRIVGKSNDRYVLTPSGGSLYGDIYKETLTRSGFVKKKLISTDTAAGKSNIQLAGYAPGCVLPDETSMVGICENFAGRIHMQRVGIPFAVDGDLPQTITPQDYCGYVKVLHEPSGRFAYFYRGKWHDADGYDFVKKKGLFSDKPVFVPNTNIGYMYYCTDLKKYITWNGVKWTDMTGNAV